MMKQLRKRISKGEKAMQASGYILPLLESYSHEIFLSLEKGENLARLHGIAYIIKKIKDDIKRDISQAEDAKKMMMNKSLNKE